MPVPETCQQAGAAAERADGIPTGLLNAIGRVESGRRDPLTGRMAAWPWTINAGGKGAFFATRAQAVNAVRSLLSAGINSIDVGCFQVNLQWHPGAFASLDEAFTPASNARYAAQFLASLRGGDPGWDDAVARYHSATPGLGSAYRTLVLANWQTNGAGFMNEGLAVAPDAVVILMSAAARGVRVWNGTTLTQQGGGDTGLPRIITPFDKR